MIRANGKKPTSYLWLTEVGLRVDLEVAAARGVDLNPEGLAQRRDDPTRAGDHRRGRPIRRAHDQKAFLVDLGKLNRSFAYLVCITRKRYLETWTSGFRMTHVLIGECCLQSKSIVQPIALET